MFLERLLTMVIQRNLAFKVSLKAGNTLEGDVSDVITLDQLMSPFSPRKVTKMSPLFSTKYGFNIHFNIHTRHQLVFGLG